MHFFNRHIENVLLLLLIQKSVSNEIHLSNEVKLFFLYVQVLVYDCVFVIFSDLSF